jgi:hypothetical protein
MNRYKILCSWDSNNGITNRVKKNFIIPNDIKIVKEGDEYDYIIMFNGYNKNENNHIDFSKTFLFVNEPHWYCNSHNIIRSSINKAEYLITNDKNLIKNDKKTIESPSIMFHHFLRNNNIQEYLNDNNFAKKNKLSIICSNKNIEASSSIYNYRINFVKNLLQTDINFHLFGNGWNINDKRYMGACVDKYDGLIDYEYSICIENTIEKNYITEKFFDCLLTNTVPIYHGCPNINDVYNEKGFINLSNVNLRELPKNDIYKEYVLENKLKYVSEYNPFTVIKKILKHV